MSETDHEWEALEQDLCGELDREPPTHICKFCKQGSLHWEEVDDKWKLVHPNGRIHNCRKPIKEL